MLFHYCQAYEKSMHSFMGTTHTHQGFPKTLTKASFPALQVAGPRDNLAKNRKLQQNF